MESASRIADLEQAAVSGDRDALAQLLVEHGPALGKRLKYRLELNPFADFSVEDVLQEVFIDAFRGIASYRSTEGASFKAWLNKVADNRLASLMRHRSRLKRGGGNRQVSWAESPLHSSIKLLVHTLNDRPDGTASEQVAREEAVAAVREGLLALPADQRDAVEARYFAHRSIDSTADALRTTPAAVRGLLHRAKRTLRSTLGRSSRWFLRR